MLKKRLIGTVIVKENFAVQSFGYNKYLPLGKAEFVLKNLDDWYIDEILVLSIDRSKNSLGPDFKLLENISRLNLSTPLIYGGGIRTVEDALDVIKLGADRIIIDSMLHHSPSSVLECSESLGAQAIILSIPLFYKALSVKWFDYKLKILKPLSQELISVITPQVVSEILIVDYQHEGIPNSFNQKIINNFPIKDIPLILFGGISEVNQLMNFSNIINIQGIAIGNFLNYKEIAVQNLKSKLSNNFFRPPNFKIRFQDILHE